MHNFKTRRSLYRTRTVRSITHTMKAIASKYLIDIRGDQNKTPPRKSNSIKPQYSYRKEDTVLDRIISKLRRNFKAQDIILMITPASRHVNQYKLHVIQHQKQAHLGMTTITHKELMRLRNSKAFGRYCIVFGSRYIDLKTVVLQSETIKALINSLNKNYCKDSKVKQLPPENSITFTKSITSSAGDYLNNAADSTIKFQDSFIQTDPEIAENTTFSLNDILEVIQIINHSREPSSKDIERFFCMADKLKFSLVIRPELLWRDSMINRKNQEGCIYFQVEIYIPGNSYLGSITLLESEILQQLDLHPKLLLNTHVIEDVYEITPLPKILVEILRKCFEFLKLELLYDALGEFIFDWYKNYTFL